MHSSTASRPAGGRSFPTSTRNRPTWCTRSTRSAAPRCAPATSFASTSGPRLHRRAANIVVHETADPEVVVAEFEYQGTVADTGEPFVLPGIFVLRVRAGEIVSSRDYFDHVTAARIRGQLDGLVEAVRRQR